MVNVLGHHIIIINCNKIDNGSKVKREGTGPNVYPMNGFYCKELTNGAREDGFALSLS